MRFAISPADKGARVLLWGLLWSCIFLSAFRPELSSAAELSTFGGGELDIHGQGFSYLGIDLTQHIDETVAVAARVMPNYLTYKYYSGNSLISATSPGVFALGGVKFFWDRTMLALYGGAELRNTDLNPDDVNAKPRGSTTAGMVQGELDKWLTDRTNLYVLTSYSATSDFIYEKGRLKWQITNLDYSKANTIFVGIEEFFGSNRDFQGGGGGLVLELFHIPFKVSIALRGGFKYDSTFGSGAYAGLDFYKGF
jgi:hypothetical protein